MHATDVCTEHIFSGHKGDGHAVVSTVFLCVLLTNTKFVWIINLLHSLAFCLLYSPHQSRAFFSCPCLFTVPLRTPELSLTSQSSTDIQVSWQPLPAKLSRGRLSAYRLSYRTAADNTVISVEIPQNSTEYLLDGLQPDTIYLLRMAAATRAGWCEPSAWTSHRTPKTSSSKGKPKKERLFQIFERWWYKVVCYSYKCNHMAV